MFATAENGVMPLSLRPLYSFVFFFSVLLFCPGPAHAQGEVSDKAIYHRAVAYCRAAAARPMALSADQKTLCFDGLIDKDTDGSLITNLNDGGLFVVRSSGGDIATAIALSDLLRDRHATVVVYDYCYSSCANYLLIASRNAFVLKGALVAWDYESSDPAFPSCARFAPERTRTGDFRLQRGSCRPASDRKAEWRMILSAQRRFFRERMVDPYFEPPPDSRHVRKAVRSLYRETGVQPHVAWTLHPRYFAGLFRSNIIYEAYPESQAEIDDILARLHLQMRVIYDP
jgi:hypothetical protein